MKILEIYKQWFRTDYNNDLQRVLCEYENNNDFIVWTAERVKSAFNFGNGTEKDLKKHIANNKCYCIFYDLEKGVIL